MGRRVDVDDLVDAVGIADRLGIAQPQTVHLWRKRYPDFPKPVAEFTRLLVWDWLEVRQWAQETGRLPAE